MIEDTSSEDFFEAKYQQNRDPWNFATSSYEQSRYTAIMSGLRGRWYRRAFEPGCSVGILTEKLAHLCGRVDGLELSPTAVDQARLRCLHLSNVSIAQGSLADAVPQGSFDLVVLSEIGYYFDPPQLAQIAAHLVSLLEPGGVLLAAHWLGFSADHKLSGDQVHHILGSLPGITLDFSQRFDGFRLDKWTASVQEAGR